MGLDVYLYRYEDFDSFEKRRKEVEAMEQKFYDEVAKQKGITVDELNEDGRDNAYALFKYWAKGQPDLDEHGDVIVGAKCEKIEMDSPQCPDNICNIGYFRSSYNSGGLNHVLRETIGNDKDLYTIFASGFHSNDEYYVRPDWNDALENAKMALKEFQEYVNVAGKYHVYMADFSPFSAPDDMPGSEKEAMERFLNELNSGRASSWGDSAYSGKDGTFSLKKPMEVFGIIRGTKESWASKLRGGEQKEVCTYLICKNEHKYASYLDSLKVVIETIEYVLAQPDPEKYVLHWSG